MKDTIVSKAFPQPNISAIPMRVGFHTPQRYKMKKVP